MDPTSNQAPGMSFPQPPGGQDGSVMPSSMAGVAINATPQAHAVPPVIPIMADDSASDEELDQEWVNKAKDIVEHTKGDPFAQSNELNKIKAEYLKARFNKDLNVGGKSS